jgi:hypothetical protein
LITKGLGEGLIAFPYLAIPYAYLQYREAGTRGTRKPGAQEGLVANTADPSGALKKAVL